jgi:transposase
VEPAGDPLASPARRLAADIRALGTLQVRARQEAHAAGLPYITDAELSARLTAAKATPERAWLAEVSAAVLQQALADLNTAYRSFRLRHGQAEGSA